MRLARHISNAQPDHYEGVHPKDINAEVKRRLSSLIIPTKVGQTWEPAAPNYFLEVTSRSQIGERGRRQVGYDGVLGARAIHSLQNYLRETDVYDGNAYTFGLTYYRFDLTIYAIYMTAPSEGGRKPRYDITEIVHYSLRDRDKFPKGIIACRNIRDLAREYREKFVKEANERDNQMNTQTPSTFGFGTDLQENDAEESTGSGVLHVDAEPQEAGDGRDNVSPDNVRGMRRVFEPAFNSTLSFTGVILPTIESQTRGYNLRSRRRREETPEERPSKKTRR